MRTIAHHRDEVKRELAHKGCTAVSCQGEKTPREADTDSIHPRPRHTFKLKAVSLSRQALTGKRTFFELDRLLLEHYFHRLK